MNARTIGILQALRNSHGPSWLVSYTLPKPEPASERPSAVIAVTADNGDIYEATRASKNEAWTITIPKGRIGLPERRLSFARILSG